MFTQQTPLLSAPRARWAYRIGWCLTGVFAAFMLAASVTPKVAGMAVARDTLSSVGWSPGAAVPIGLVELGCVLLYLWRRTSILGAVLATALLGGAMATQMRVGAPQFSHALFGVYLGVIMWGGLWLRDPALRALFPWRTANATQA